MATSDQKSTSAAIALGAAVVLGAVALAELLSDDEEQDHKARPASVDRTKKMRRLEKKVGRW